MEPKVKIETNVTRASNISSNETFIRIVPNSRGFTIFTSLNLKIGGTIFLESETHLAKDLLFDELNNILKYDEPLTGSSTHYVCPKCNKGILVFDGSHWKCDNCNFKLPHYIKQEVK